MGPADRTVLDPGALAVPRGLVALSVISAVVGATIIWRRPDNHVGALLLIGAVLLASDAAAWWILVDRRTVRHEHPPYDADLVGDRQRPAGGLRAVPLGRPVLPGRAAAGPTVAMRRTSRRSQLSSSGWSSRRSRRLAPTRPATSSAVRSPSPASRQPSATSAACWRVVAVLAAFLLARRVSDGPLSPVGGCRAGTGQVAGGRCAGQLDHVPGFLPRDVGFLDVVGVAAGCLIPISIGIAVRATACTTSIASSAARCRGRS